MNNHNLRCRLLCLLAVVLIFFSGCSSCKDYYRELPVLKKQNDFMSRNVVTFNDINGKDVTVHTFTRKPDESANNPNFGEGILLYECLQYKIAHPEEEVYVSFTSFRVSIVASVCVDPESQYYGYMKSLYEKDEDSDGFVRISSMLVKAAKLGIHVTIIGQLDASPVKQNLFDREDLHFDEYFESHLDDACDYNYTPEGSVVSDYMNFVKSEWTSYNNKAATDMMHLKCMCVSAYRDSLGVDHTSATWLGSTNLDGIDAMGYNGHNSIQTGIIVSDHDEIYKAAYNYIQLLSKHQDIEGVNTFRATMVERNTRQIDLILSGKEDEIPEDEKVVYLGSENDSVFSIYFTPLGGPVQSWAEKYNPFCKYIAKLDTDDARIDCIDMIWINVKYYTDFDLAVNYMKKIDKAFAAYENNPRWVGNRLYLHLPKIGTSVNVSTFYTDLSVGSNIGLKNINQYTDIKYHMKDMFLSYLENYKRHYVSVFNSCNFHKGSMSYQSNFILVIDETSDNTNGNVFYSYVPLATNNIITKKRNTIE